jgi:phage I-like protein
MNKKEIVIFGSETDLSSQVLKIGQADPVVPLEFDLLVEGAAYPKAKDINGKIQPFIITAEHIDSAVRHLAQRRERAPKRDLVVDYEHQTLKDIQAPAAGWMNGLVSIVRDGKKVLRAQMSEWTSKANEYLKNHEYRYVSPVFALNGRDKVTGEIFPCMILSAALTNEPLIDELQPIVAKQYFQTISGKDTSMNEVIKKLCAFLGIAETADEQTVAAKFTEFAANVKTALAATTEIAAKDVLMYISGAKIAIAAKTDLVKVICAKDGATIEEATAIHIAAKESAAKVVTLQTELDALKTKEVNAAVDAIVAKGITDGKITPATKDAMRIFAAKDIKAFETYLAAAPVILPSGKLPEGGEQIVAGKDGLTDADKAIAATFKLKPEDVAKYNPAKK